nr:unnamed protein product [Callosobruchus analis]
MMVVLPLEAPMRRLDVTGSLSVIISSSLVTMVAMFPIVCRMLSMTFPDDDCFESSMGMGRILDYAMGTIWFLEHVLPNHLLSFPMLELAFVVVGMWIVDTVLEFVVDVVIRYGHAAYDACGAD